jgi:3-phosphoshikimate 1-carboxyvinyltransferase
MPEETITIETRGPLDATVTIPGSKSCTARALVMAALTNGVTTLLDPADCEDSDHMLAGLRGLGLAVSKGQGRVTVEGGALRAPEASLFLGNSGTAMRFLTAACASVRGTVTLDGTGRMRERPIGDLVDALRGWGVAVDATSGCPPVTVRGTGQFGGETSVRGDASSQYLTGLLLAAPMATAGAVVRIDGELVSKPYITLTLDMMAERGVGVMNDDFQSFRVEPGQQYRPGAYPVEADASGASYFFGAAAVAGGRVRVLHLTSASSQGDARFPEVLGQMGCTVTEGPGWTEVTGAARLRGIDIDLNDMPDMAQTLAVVALFADGPTRIRNVANLRIKETDRIAAMANELRKLGASVEEHADGLLIVPGEMRGAVLDTYDDHRMAMSLALAGLRVPGVTLRDPGCVRKTFPDFFDRFAGLR